MFSFIDTKLINVAQWIVRQIELFTSLTRKQFIDCNFQLLKWLLITFWLIGALTLIIDVTGYIPMAIFVISITYNYYRVTKNELGKDSRSSGTLPTEIVSRKGLRIPFVIMSVILIDSTLRYAYSQEVDNFVIFLSFFCSILMFLTTIIEYFLCTTPLPPGEKERKKMEREMKNLVV